MGPLIDPQAGVDAREAAIQQAEEGANPVWTQAADWAVRLLAYRQASFTTDEVWWLLDELGMRTAEPRAMGPVMRRAAAARVVQASDSWRRSYRPQCHARPILRWRSLLYGQPLPSDFLAKQPR